MRKTKIICTIGPASDEESVLRRMCDAGMNVARLNFSHGTHADHLERIERIKRVREEMELPLAIMLDTKGPEYRIKTFENHRVTVQDGADFTFTTEDVVGNEERVAVNYDGLPEELNIGDRILVNNGLLIFEVVEIRDRNIRCRTVAGGEISDRKSMSFPNKVLGRAYLSEEDRADILFGIRNGVDFIAASFVSRKQDLLDMRAFLNENGGEDIDIIAKIENRAGIDNIDEICEACQGIMIARGDLGVEVPFAELPTIQKNLITKCRLLGKRVITATEMLESMIHNPRPTRAEISDVANAVFDGTSAIMLSGESAAGKYPVEAVKVMAEIAYETEQHIDYAERFRTSTFLIKNKVDAISHATCGMAIDLEAKVIVVNSASGSTVRMVSRFRAPADIIGMTIERRAWYKLALSWGVTPVMSEEVNSTDVMFYHGLRAAKKYMNLQKGDIAVMTGGMTTSRIGGTNTIRVETV